MESVTDVIMLYIKVVYKRRLNFLHFLTTSTTKREEEKGRRKKKLKKERKKEKKNKVYSIRELPKESRRVKLQNYGVYITEPR